MKFQILLFGTIAALAVILGGALVYFKRSWPKRIQEMMLALGAGFILALVFLKLVPSSFKIIGESAAIYMLLGYSVIHFFEHTVATHLHFGEETHTEVMVSHVASISAFTGLFIHAFFDGVSISVGMQFNALVGILVFVAILLHKLPEGLTIGSIVLAAGFPRRTIITAALALGFATLLGVCTIFVFERVSEQLTGAAFAFSAGVAVYVGASDLVPEVNKSEERTPPLLVFVGILLFFLSESLLEKLVG
ncbi:MAG: ZIP family metal transporter [bacterium]